MEPLVYLAGLKQGAWLTKTGQYSTDLASASTYSLSNALIIAKRHKEASNILLPVSVDWMKAI